MCLFYDMRMKMHEQAAEKEKNLVIDTRFDKQYLAPSEGIEPPAEEPESSVLSITPRGHIK